MNVKKQKKIIFTTENLDNLKNNTCASYKTMKKLTNFIRCSAGRKSIPKNYMQHVSEKTNTLEKFYKSNVLKFDVEKSNLKEDRTVIWADAEELLEAVIDERNLIGNYVVKVMADGGQGFFKVNMKGFR